MISGDGLPKLDEVNVMQLAFAAAYSSQRLLGERIANWMAHLRQPSEDIADLLAAFGNAPSSGIANLSVTFTSGLSSHFRPSNDASIRAAQPAGKKRIGRGTFYP